MFPPYERIHCGSPRTPTSLRGKSVYLAYGFTQRRTCGSAVPVPGPVTTRYRAPAGINLAAVSKTARCVRPTVRAGCSARDALDLVVPIWMSLRVCRSSVGTVHNVAMTEATIATHVTTAP